MAEIKKAAKGETEQKVPRGVLSEGILTIEVDSHVETEYDAGRTGGCKVASAVECTAYQKDPYRAACRN